LRNAGGGGNSSFDAAADASISFDTVYTGLGVAPTSSVPIEVSYRLSSLTFFGGSLMMAHSESAVSLRDSLGTVLDSASISTLVDASVYDQINNLNGILAFDVTLGTQYSSMISANSGLYAGGGLTITLDNPSGVINAHSLSWAEMSVSIAPNFAYFNDYELRLPPSSLGRNPDFVMPSLAPVPVPAALPLFASALALFGLLSRSRGGHCLVN